MTGLSLRCPNCDRWLEVEDREAAFIVQAHEGWSHAIERALEAEKRVEELENQVDILSTTLSLLYEKWKADLLMDNSLWQSASGPPSITQEVWYELVAVHTELNKVLHKAKEILGDE